MAYTIGALAPTPTFTLAPGAAAAIAARGTRPVAPIIQTRTTAPSGGGEGGGDGDGADKGMSPGMIAAGVVAIAALAYVALR